MSSINASSNYEMDYFLADDPEFNEYMKRNNLSNESLKRIENHIKRSYDRLQKKLDIVVEQYFVPANVRNQDQENVAPPATAIKNVSGKRSARNSSISNGKSGCSTEIKPSKNDNSIGQDIIDIDLSQELEEKVNLSSKAHLQSKVKTSGESSVYTIPRGKVRIQFFSDPSFDKPSPYDGEVRIVEPTGNASQRCKVGRSTAKEYSEFGISLSKDIEASTKHGVFTRTGTSKGIYEYYFTDFGSTNGTRDVTHEPTDGVKLDPYEPYKLADGTKLRVGKSVLVLNFSS